MPLSKTDLTPAQSQERPCFDDPKYWRDMARNERLFANEDRARRGGTVESIRIHESNAAEYEARAIALEARSTKVHS